MAVRVLVVDDATFMRMMVKDILSKNGYEVVGEAQALDTVSLNGKSELETSRFDSYKLNPSPLSVAAFNA